MSGTIDSLIQSSSTSKLEWIPCSEITDIKSTPTDAIYYANRKYERLGRIKETMIMLLFLGNSEECTPASVSTFTRIYSLPTDEYNNELTSSEDFPLGLRSATNS